MRSVQRLLSNKEMRKALLMFFSVLFLVACSEKRGQEQKQAVDVPAKTEQAVTESGYTVEIIAGEANSYGYDIKKDGKLLIHQPHVPGVAGVRGFDTELQARAAAQLMISKMEKNIMPPTVSEHEIDSIRSLR
jgi:hypothetical protein